MYELRQFEAAGHRLPAAAKQIPPLYQTGCEVAPRGAPIAGLVSGLPHGSQETFQFNSQCFADLVVRTVECAKGYTIQLAHTPENQRPDWIW